MDEECIYDKRLVGFKIKNRMVYKIGIQCRSTNISLAN